MKPFYSNLSNSQKQKKYFNRFYKVRNSNMAAWCLRHIKILKHAGLGGKSRLLEKGHVQWNRKGRW